MCTVSVVYLVELSVVIMYVHIVFCKVRRTKISHNDDDWSSGWRVFCARRLYDVSVNHPAC